MTSNPADIPANNDGFENKSDFSFIYWKIDNTTWKIAPAPIARKTRVKKGEKKNPPIQVPKIAGIPAISPSPIILAIFAFVPVNGAAIANPSVVLWVANPIIRNVLKATSPSAIAAPTANPSPRLWNPIPIAIIREIANPFDKLENSVLLINFLPIPYNDKNDKMTTVEINNSPLKTEERWFLEISDASSTASIPRKINNPIVTARKKLNEFFPSFLMNGYHKRPIIIGTTPIKNPIIPRNTNKSRLGSSAGKAASILLANLVPSSIVIPISYGWPSFQSKGILTSAVSNRSSEESGSIAAGCIRSFTSAITTLTSIGPVFLTVACISFPINSNFSIYTSWSTKTNCKNDDAGPKRNTIIITNKTIGAIALIASTGLDDVIILYFSIKIISIFFYKKSANPTFFRKFCVMCMEHVQSRIFVIEF